MIAIIHGKLLTVTHGVIEDGTILIDKGKITAVGKDVKVPEGTQVIDASDKWVTPGLIDAHTHISGMNEPSWMKLVMDANEITDPITPQVRMLDAFNPFDEAIPKVREAGFTTGCTLPGSANVIGGQGFAFKLKKAETVLDMMIPGTTVMKMALGENPKRCYGQKDRMPMTRMGTGAVLRETLYKAKVYSDKLLKAQKDPSFYVEPDFRLDPLVPVVRGEMRCRIHCHRADDIVTAVRVCEEFHLKYSLEHCTEGYKILDFLKSRNVTAVVGPLKMGPVKYEIWGTRQDTPAVFEKAGINFCLTADSASDTRWLPVDVGLCMRCGLSFETALESVTIRPATLLGLEDRIGSLEVGKDADIAIFDGMPFENLTNCTTTIIDGKVEYNTL